MFRGLQLICPFLYVFLHVIMMIRGGDERSCQMRKENGLIIHFCPQLLSQKDVRDCQILRSLEARFIFLSSKKSQRRQEVDLVNLRLFQEWWSPWEENCHRAIVLNSVQGSTVRRRSPWKTGQHSQQGRTGEDEGPSQLKDAEDNTGPKLRKSTRMWKPNPKYENSAYAEVMKGEAVLSNTSEALKEKSGGANFI